MAAARPERMSVGEEIDRCEQTPMRSGGDARRRAQGARHARDNLEIPDVKAICRSLRMSQHRFAAAYRIPLPTLKNWSRDGTPTRPRRRICSPSSGGPRRSGSRRALSAHSIPTTPPQPSVSDILAR